MAMGRLRSQHIVFFVAYCLCECTCIYQKQNVEARGLQKVKICLQHHRNFALRDRIHALRGGLAKESNNMDKYSDIPLSEPGRDDARLKQAIFSLLYGKEQVSELPQEVEAYKVIEKDGTYRPTDHSGHLHIEGM